MNNPTYRIEAALKIAAERHGMEFRKGGARLPYLIHPLQVVERFGRWGLTWDHDPIVVPAAILHDALEDIPAIDHDYWAARISYEVCPATLALVKELTFYPIESSSKSRQKEEYLKSFGAKSIAALNIKVADRLCNVEDFFNAGDDYANAYFLKAEPLFAAALAREQEFSPDLFKLMIDDIELVRRRVGAA